MKLLFKTILAICFALFLVQILVGINKQAPLKLSFWSAVGLLVVAAALYYLVFEFRPKKKK